MEQEVQLSILIPTYNGWPLLKRCLQSVREHRPADSEVVVVDDGSRDETAYRLRRDWPWVRVVRLPRNRGFCAAANAGLKACRGTIVELLNNDTEVTAGWTEAPLRALEADGVGSVAPLVRKLPFRRQVDSAGDDYYFFGMAKKRGEGRDNIAATELPSKVFGASASSAFYRRAALEQVGGFPEHFGAYLDDVDLAFRLRLAGYRCMFVPQSRVFHWVTSTYALGSREMQSRVALNSERVFWTNLTKRQLALHVFPHLAYVLVQLAQKTVKGEFGPWFAGKSAAIAELPNMLRYRRRAQLLRS